MNHQSVDIPVNDIKPLVDVPDYSLYYFIGLSAIAIAVAVSAVLFVRKRFGNRKRDERRELYAQLASIDFSNPKQAAYRISQIGHRFARDNERTEKAYQNLFERLEPYKYAPEVKPIDEETLGYYRLYLEIVDA